ncbi:MAG TPA: hypothetical protein PLS45_08990, partial [Bacillota bacterium]|nr:hypothetical protein [Bacillota bacterium]
MKKRAIDYIRSLTDVQLVGKLLPSKTEPDPIDLLSRITIYIKRLPNVEDRDELTEDLWEWYRYYKPFILRYMEKKGADVLDIHNFERSRKDCLSALKTGGSITLTFSNGKISWVVVRRLKGGKPYDIPSVITEDFRKQVSGPYDLDTLRQEIKGLADDRIKQMQQTFNFLLGDDADLTLRKGGVLYAIVEQVLQKTLDSWDGYKDMYLGKERNNLNRKMIFLLNPLWQWWRDNKLYQLLYNNKSSTFDSSKGEREFFKQFIQEFFNIDLPLSMLVSELR